MKNSINSEVRTRLINTKTRLNGKIQAITKEVLLQIRFRLISRSPVGNPDTWASGHWPKGYVPGHFINNWQVGIDYVPIGTISSVDPSGEASMVRTSKLGRWQVGHTYYFVNNLPYASALENGWSKQAPRGMVALTKMEFSAIVREAEAKIIGSGANVTEHD